MGRGHNIFPMKTYRLANVKRCSTSLIIREMQNHNELLHYACQNGYYQKYKRLEVLAMMWKAENSCAFLGGNVN